MRNSTVAVDPYVLAMENNLGRRGFLRLTGTAALTASLGSALTACGSADKKSTSAKPGRTVRLGFIALTDCAPLVMAKELGYFAERDLNVELIKQASWPATRDNLLNGQIDAAHALFSLPLSVASKIAGTGSTDLKIAMVLNNNGQAITLKKDFADAGYADLDAARALLEKKSPTLAMTFPGGTHDTWLRYWLKATKADLSGVKIVPVPPPQMVANMKVGNMDGYCVGEPWNAVAVQQDIGFTHLTTQDLWQHHPEKALVAGAKFASERKEVLADVMGAILKAAKWLDDLDNRAKAATTIGAAKYVNAPAKNIEGRLLGTYELGSDLGEKKYSGDQMMFFRDGKASAPRRAHAIWFLSQYQRFGLLNEAPPYAKIADEIVLRDLYEEVAGKEGIDVPGDDMSPFPVKLDGATFDPAKPQEEAKRK
ncbi:CmpA/NrtA family ABC transporter substrate-binding protein [Streptomyces sp. NPDC005407]|uniref:CmpA/NrtA family ABC transporter substrate-binding protein n=1 Tax=Streptomyces sp. NPDC005407 TaxID=3155340 RepID=UPI0033AC1478